MPLRFRMQFVLDPQPPAATTIGQIKHWIQRCFNLEPEFIRLKVQGLEDEPDNDDDIAFLELGGDEQIGVTVNPDVLPPFQVARPQSVGDLRSKVAVDVAVAPAQLMESGGSEQEINILDPNVQDELHNILAPIPQNMVAPACSGPSQPGPSQPGPSQQKRGFELMDPVADPAADPAAESANKRMKLLEDGVIQMPVRLKPTGITTMPIPITRNDSVNSFAQKVIDIHQLSGAGLLRIGGTELPPDQNLFDILLAHPQLELDL